MEAPSVTFVLCLNCLYPATVEAGRLDQEDEALLNTGCRDVPYLESLADPVRPCITAVYPSRTVISTSIAGHGGEPDTWELR